MARDKKGKKGRGEETGEEVVAKETIKESHDTPSAGRSGKKGKLAEKGDERIDNITVGTDNLSLNKESHDHSETRKEKSKVSKQGKKGKGRDPGDYEDEVQTGKDHSEDIKDTKRKKGLKKGKPVVNDDDDDEVGENKEQWVKSPYDSNGTGLGRTKNCARDIVSSDEGDNEMLATGKSKLEKISAKQKKNKSAQKNVDAFDSDTSATKSNFQLLAIEGDDDADSESEVKMQKSDSQTPLDKKEEMKLETKGGKKSKKKERKKKDDDDEDLDKLLQELALEMTGQTPVDKPTEPEKVEEDISEVKPGKKKKTKKETEPKSETVEGKELDSNVVAVEDEQHTVKTAAQKRKEKKEKERQKKIAQHEQSVPSKKSSNAELKSQHKDDAVVTPEREEIPEVNEEEKDEDADDSKKKKKKKKGGEEEKKEKKGPGKKQIAAMKEALKKVREEEERLRLEEAAKIKAEEEAERLRQEKLRLEQERKEKKKQKEKEKRERLKAEGKLLTKAQRQNRARMEATLAALRQQGVEVPQIGEKKERAPRLGDKKRLPKKKNDATQVLENKEEVTDFSVEIKDSSPEVETELETEKIPVEVEKEKEEDEVKDAWDESTDEDESEQSLQVDIKLVKSKLSSTESTDESESDESDESEESDSEESEDTESEGKTNDEKIRERALERIKKRREENENNRSTSILRSPVVCVLGHVDTGKTKILDKIRRTNVQDNECGGITQQIGATMVPQEALKEQCKMVKNFADMELKVPGLLIIDTPGHESFSNLRSRGSSLCDIAVLVVDIMHGLEPQTLESINLLKQKKTPFIVALNKIDRLYEWKSSKTKDIQDVIKSQARNTKMEFEDRAKEVILQFANQGLNAVLYYDNSDPRSYISMVPTSAMTGDGMGNLMALVVQLTQQMMAKRLSFSEELQATVLEVKAIPGLGTTIDAILINGRLHEGDTIVLAGYEGSVVTQIRSLLMPEPLKELRVKNPYHEYKEVQGAQGVKITGKDLDKAIAGLQLLVAHHPDEIPILKDEVASSFREAMNHIKLAERGVYVQASTLGSLEALLDFLRTSKIPYSGIRIGPVVKKDVMKASIMLEHDSQYAVILAFDVKIEKDAQELADSLGVKILQADIIYHLFDKFTAYRDELKNKKRDELKNLAVFPCKLRILPQYVFNSRDPIVVGVVVESGIVKEGTPLCVPSKEFLDIGTVTTIEVNHKAIESARKGQEVCIKIEPIGGEAPKMYGRHFEHTDLLVSKITRQSIDLCKEYFRDDLLKTDWQLMVELKKIFQIL